MTPARKATEPHRMTPEYRQDRIAVLEKTISVCTRELTKLKEDQRNYDSLEFVRASGITRKDVFYSEDFTYKDVFDSIKTMPQKPYLCWNDIVYPINGVLSKRLCLWDHVPE